MGKRTTELIRGAELSERSRMARCQQTKGRGWQSAGSMKNTASLGLLKHRESRERERGATAGRNGRGERQGEREREEESKAA